MVFASSWYERPRYKITGCTVPGTKPEHVGVERKAIQNRTFFVKRNNCILRVHVSGGPITSFLTSVGGYAAMLVSGIQSAGGEGDGGSVTVTAHLGL